jgi:FMN phosphatase YigB (HAD superfamily)
VHVGDTREEDVDGAHAAGIRALLIDREGGGDVASLEEVAARL